VEIELDIARNECGPGEQANHRACKSTCETTTAGVLELGADPGRASLVASGALSGKKAAGRHHKLNNSIVVYKATLVSNTFNSMSYA